MQYLPRLIHDIHEKKFHFGLPKKNAVLRKYYAEKNLVQKMGIVCPQPSEIGHCSSTLIMISPTHFNRR